MEDWLDYRLQLLWVWEEDTLTSLELLTVIEPSAPELRAIAAALAIIRNELRLYARRVIEGSGGKRR